MYLGSRPFCVINMDGSWPEMATGCDIQAYQDCLLQFKDAWKTVHDQGKGKVGACKTNNRRAVPSRPHISK